MYFQKTFGGHLCFRTETWLEKNKFSLSIFSCSSSVQLSFRISIAFVSRNLYKYNDQDRRDRIWGPVHTYPDIFESALQSGKNESETNLIAFGRWIQIFFNPMTRQNWIQSLPRGYSTWPPLFGPISTFVLFCDFKEKLNLIISPNKGINLALLVFLRVLAWLRHISKRSKQTNKQTKIERKKDRKKDRN